MKILIKLGGSVITYKRSVNFPTEISRILVEGDKFIRKNVLRNLAKEISEARKETQAKVVVINGAGPFGHVMVKRYLEIGDVKVEDIQRSVEYLNSKVVEALAENNLKVVSLPPHETCFYDGSFRIEKLFKLLEKFTNAGYVVSTYGDCIPTNVNTKYGEFQVISGDDLILEIGKLWRPDRIVIATDVDGVFTKDPKVYKDAIFIPELTEGMVKGVDFSISTVDVTGGMKSKVEKLLKLASLGFRSIIVNGLKNGRLKRAILGESCGTVFL